MSALQGKTAVVTGGASGIGAATARAFAAAGAQVVIGDVQDGSAIAREIGGIFVATDVRRSEQVQALVGRAVSEHGRLDEFFNNAGIEIHAPLVATEDEQHRNLIDVNLNGVFYGLKHAVAAMLNNGAPAGGSIINTASVAGIEGSPLLGSYAASKHAVVGLTRTAALEYGRFGIRVNAICPGVIRTPMVTTFEFGEQAMAQVASAHALGRIGEPSEVAAVVVFLASDAASFVSGIAMPVDGGLSAGLIGRD
jgi:NAD(P)-dependent dehydrogenase (short-subunit alcohol dehydrogenase family)